MIILSHLAVKIDASRQQWRIMAYHNELWRIGDEYAFYKSVSGSYKCSHAITAKFERLPQALHPLYQRARALHLSFRSRLSFQRLRKEFTVQRPFGQRRPQWKLLRFDSLLAGVRVDKNVDCLNCLFTCWTKHFIAKLANFFLSTDETSAGLFKI